MEKKKQKLIKKKEITKTDVQSQNNDAPFSFTWAAKSDKKTHGTVFKKKPTRVKDKPDPTNKISAQEVTKPQSFNQSKHIKRKRRKDKLLAKQGGGVEIKTIDTHKTTHSLFADKQRDIYVNARVGKSVSEVVFTKNTKFSDLDLHKHLVSNLEKIDFNMLTNVQEKSIPVLLEGKNALIRSQTGSGKTLAYALPIMDALLCLEPRIKRSDGVQVLIVVPTRELALQTHEEFNRINTFQWIVTGHLCGGESRKTEKDRIRKGLSILIGTPGRLLDHALHTSALDLSKVRCLVLDEADRLLDMGFRKDVVSLIEKIDSSKSNSSYNPMEMLIKQGRKTVFNEDDENETSRVPVLKDVHSKERQSVLLSATLSKGISELAELTMKDHVYIDALDETQAANEDDFVIPNTVKQEFLITPVKHRLFTLCSIIIAKSKQNSKLFVFMASTRMVEFHYELFTKYLVSMPKNRGKQKIKTFKGEKVVIFDEESIEESDEEEPVMDIEFFKLHGNMDQKERKEVFRKFCKVKNGVLICTDVAARGLDVPDADCIIQYTPPQSDKDYLHRIGRTGRAGRSGSAIIFLTHEEQEYISHLNEHKVFLKKRDPKEFLPHLCDVMEEPNVEEAATALQRHFETKVAKDKSLHKSACFAYSTWSRFYNSYPATLRPIFDFKRVNGGHYVSSFALTITPTEVSRVVRGQVGNIEKTPLNKKLANHEEDIQRKATSPKKRKYLSLTTSEYSSGLEPSKKKRKKKISTE